LGEVKPVAITQKVDDDSNGESKKDCI